MNTGKVTNVNRQFLFDGAAVELGLLPIVAPAGAASTIIAQATSVFRFVFSRVFGRVN